jgi:hypothetical protein
MMDLRQWPDHVHGPMERRYSKLGFSNVFVISMELLFDRVNAHISNIQLLLALRPQASGHASNKSTKAENYFYQWAIMRTKFLIHRFP